MAKIRTPRTVRSRSSGETEPVRQKRRKKAESADRYTGLRSIFNPLWCYNAFRVGVLILTAFGVIMVFSSSTVSLVSAGKSPWAQAFKQGLFCVIGLGAGFVTSKVPVKVYRRMSNAILLFSMFLQSLTFTPLGVEVDGNRSWIGIGTSFTVQPAEVMKLALCIWLPLKVSKATRQAVKQKEQLEALKQYALPIGGFVACVILILIGKDMGTCIIIGFIGLAAFTLGGFPLKWIGTACAIGLIGVVGLVAINPSRLSRVLATYGTCSAEQAQGVCYQTIHAKYAMASGGLFGVGIGNSSEKWGYLPAAHNDFIFAIIGEETGFIGASLVILLFVVIGWSMIAIAMQTKNHYVAMVLVCITVWLVGQGLVNIAVVVGLLPAMGVPMPFVSAGGSSLIMCLGAAGVVISMMREQDQVKDSRRIL